jgi:ABC-type Na+ efflux pump permease subunit
VTRLRDPEAEPHWRLVVRKEIGDLVGRIGRRPLLRTLVVVVVFGLLVPLRFEGTANLPAFFAVFMAFLPARLVAIDAYAGERERGTLEVLLASPLSDAGIAGGKIVAATVYGTARGWLFLAVWSLASALLRVTGLAPDAPLPSPDVAVAVAAAAVIVSYAAAVFGVWQSAAAPSVRAIVESGGMLRLAVILVVFFIGPWLFGLLSPDGEAPQLPLPGSRTSVSLDGVREAVLAAPASAVALAVVAGVVGVAALWWLTAAALRRGRREALALVTAEGTPRPRRAFLQPRPRGRN